MKSKYNKSSININAKKYIPGGNMFYLKDQKDSFLVNSLLFIKKQKDVLSTILKIINILI